MNNSFFARRRRAQLIKFAVTEDGEEVQKYHEWTPQDKRSVLGILIASLAIVLVLACWVGPSLKDAHAGHHVHDIHMHGFAGEVGGLISVDKANPFQEYLVKGDEVHVFDLKMIAQLNHESR